MPNLDLKSPELYFNRELSWLEFNDRVLREGVSDIVPLMERLKFLAIVSMNLDEFFMVRVGGLTQQRAAGVRKLDIAGLTPEQQLEQIAQRVHAMVEEQSRGIHEALEALAEHGLRVVGPDAWTDEQRDHMRAHVSREVMPIVTPMAMEELDPPPLLPGLRLNVIALIRKQGETGEPEEKVAVIPVPPNCARFIALPAKGKGDTFARLEDALLENIDVLLPGCPVLASTVMRITRDADVSVQDDDAADLLHAIEDAILARRRRHAVRLEVPCDADPRLRAWLVDWLELRPEEVYDIDGMLDAKALWQLVGCKGYSKLRYEDWPPQPPVDLLGEDDLWAALQDHDVMLFHPYESFDPVVQLVDEASRDPGVLAIKQTLYRTSGDSPIISALERAAQSGKEVSVLVELKARFDEAQNVNWARRLEDAGCHVIYGISGLKTHSKALMVVRREGSRIRRYVHLGTGNYNDKTAKIYSDVGVLTSNRDVANDVAAYFNLLTGYSESVGWSKLTIAPTGLGPRFLDMIDREIQASTPDRPGLIMAKVNSLEDARIIRALYRASQAGVEVKLNVRGICCLRPGLEGVSENIEVVSIVDRFLEHARIFYFRNGGHEEVYLSSADWMRRNLSKRIETMFPIVDPRLKTRAIEILETFLADNVKAKRLLPDGNWQPVPPVGPRVRAQESLYQGVAEAVRATEHASLQFKPMKRPKG